MMNTKNCKVLIFGEEYSLISSESVEHVMKAAQLVDNLMRDIVSKSSGIEHKRAAVLVALRMASETLLLERQFDEQHAIEKSLIQQIDAACSCVSSSST
jgi:cell division protein ZapA